jgi:predicted small lipoprotein YifL
MSRVGGQLVAALTLAAIAGCGVPTQKSPTLLDNDNVHIEGSAPPTTTLRDASRDRSSRASSQSIAVVRIIRELPAPASVS